MSKVCIFKLAFVSYKNGCIIFTDPEKGDQQTAKSSIFSIDHDYSELKDERVGNAVIQTSSKSSTVSNHHCFEDTQGETCKLII